MLKEIDYLPSKLNRAFIKDVSQYLRIPRDKRFGVLYDYLRLVTTLLRQMHNLTA